MSKDKQFDNIKCANTMIVAHNARTKKVEPVLSDDGKRQFTKNVLVTYVGTSDKFAPDAILQSTRLSKWQEAKPQLQLVPNVDYVLVEDSVTDWDATKTKPQAVSCTYRPAAIFVE
tara:strand:- start:56 stop:403 length:348 start_codon:yes stop_codon:yes gene_type:complete